MAAERLIRSWRTQRQSCRAFQELSNGYSCRSKAIVFHGAFQQKWRWPWKRSSPTSWRKMDNLLITSRLIWRWGRRCRVLTVVTFDVVTWPRTKGARHVNHLIRSMKFNQFFTFQWPKPHNSVENRKLKKKNIFIHFVFIEMFPWRAGSRMQISELRDEFWRRQIYKTKISKTKIYKTAIRLSV